MPPMPIVKGETEKLYSTIAEICKVDDLTDTSDESGPESGPKENSNKGKSACQDREENQEDGSMMATAADGTDASATVADVKDKTDDITEKTTAPNSDKEMPTAAPSKSDTPKRDLRREKDKFDYRREKEHRRRGRGDTVLSVACAAGRVEIVDMLVKDGRVNKDVQNDNGETPLMRCCEGSEDGSAEEHRFVECAKLLVKAGVQLNKVNFQGHTALHIAFQHKQYLVAEYLISVGVKPCPGNKKSRCQKCALNMKVWNRRRDRKEQEMLVSNAVQIETRDEHQEMDRILEEEFGEMDFEEELARMKAEMGGRSIGFANVAAVEEEMDATSLSPNASAHSVSRRQNTNRKRRKNRRKGKHRRGKRK